MLTIDLKVDGPDYLDGLLDRLEDMRPALLEVGEDMTESTKQRFVDARAPDGTPWAPNSAATLLNYSRLFAKTSSGTLKAAGVRAMGTKKPLTGETRALQTTINYQVTGPHSVSIGSPMVYANVMQFGARAGEFGAGFYKTRDGIYPIPWGDIPARPYIGASASDEQNIVDVVRRYLMG
jgi:phage gpG-like protein